MKLINRVLLFDIFCVVAEGVTLFTFVFLLRKLYRITDLMVAGGTTFSTTSMLLFSLLPSIMVLTFPMAVLLATMMVYGRLAHDNELVALQASGYSTRQLLVPALITGLILTIALMWWGYRISPKGLRIFENISAEVLRKTATTGIRPGGFNHLGNYVISVNSIEEGNMRNVRIFEYQDNKVAGVITAPTGVIDFIPTQNLLQLHLEQGTLHQLPGPDKDVVIQFAQMDFSITIYGLLEKLAEGGMHEQKYRTKFIHQEIARLRSLYEQKGRERDYRWLKRWEIERMNRIALPFACLLMALLGGILGIRSQSGKRSSCYAMTIFVIFLYYILLSFGESFVQDGTLPAWFGIWLPNFVALFFVIFLFWRTRRV